MYVKYICCNFLSRFLAQGGIVQSLHNKFRVNKSTAHHERDLQGNMGEIAAYLSQSDQERL